MPQEDTCWRTGDKLPEKSRDLQHWWNVTGLVAWACWKWSSRANGRLLPLAHIVQEKAQMQCILWTLEKDTAHGVCCSDARTRYSTGCQRWERTGGEERICSTYLCYDESYPMPLALRSRNAVIFGNVCGCEISLSVNRGIRVQNCFGFFFFFEENTYNQ